MKGLCSPKHPTLYWKISKSTTSCPQYEKLTEAVERLVTCCGKKQILGEDECFQDAAVCEAARFSAVPESHIVKWLFSPMDPLIQRHLAEEIFAVSNLF